MAGARLLAHAVAFVVAALMLTSGLGLALGAAPSGLVKSPGASEPPPGPGSASPVTPPAGGQTRIQAPEDVPALPSALPFERSSARDPTIRAFDLLNDTYVASPDSTPETYAATGMAYDSSNGLLYVLGRGTLDATDLSVVNPTANVFLGTLGFASGVANCSFAWQGGVLVFDPVVGLLFGACSGGLLVGVSPLTGDEVETVSVPTIHTGDWCTEFVPEGFEATYSAEARELFFVYTGCETVRNLTASDLLVVDTVDAATLSVISSVGLPGSPTNPLADVPASALAYDNATGELYVFYNGSSSAGSLIAVVDPASGTIVGTIAADSLGTASTSPMVYDPTLGAVLMAAPIYLVTHKHVTTLDSAILKLDLATGTADPVLLWTGHVPNPIGGGEGLPYVEPTALATGPGTPAQLTVFASAGGTMSRVLVYNLTSGAEVSNVSTLPVSEAVSLGGPTSVEGLAFSGFNEVVSVGGAPPHALATTPIALSLGAGFFGPTNGTFYVGLGGLCGSIVEPGTGSGCPNITMVRLSDDGSTPQPYVTLPAGGPVAAAYDPATGNSYVLTLCGSWVDGLTDCGTLGTPSALSEYSSSGALIAQTGLTIHYPTYEAGTASIVPDPGEHALVVAGPDGSKGAQVEVLNATTLDVEASLELPDEVLSSASLAIDPAEQTIFAWYECLVGEPLRIENCLVGLNATNLAVIGLYSSGVPASTLYSSELLTFDPLNGTLFAVNVTSIQIFSVASFPSAPVATIDTPDLVAIDFDPANGILYELAGNLTEVNASTGVTVGREVLNAAPFIGYLTVDAASGEAAVTWYASPDIDLIPAAGPTRYVVSVPESGLSPASSWTISLDGATETGLGNHQFYLPNGTYELSVGSVPGYHLNGSSPTEAIRVDGANVTVAPIAFALTVYSIEAIATAGGGSVPWALTLSQYSGVAASGPCTGCVNDSTEQSRLGANGSYDYLIRALAPGYEVQGIAPSGSLTVAGAAVELDFTLVPARTATFTFRESGVPAGTPWCAALAGGKEVCATATSYSVPDLTPATYDYRYAPVPGYSPKTALSGALALHAPSGSVRRVFVADKYLVSFVAVGLRPHTHWRVTVDGKTLSGRKTVLSIELPDGSYSYSAAPVAKYRGGGSGTVEVSGAGIGALVHFSIVLYTVTFTEAALPAGAYWDVVLAGDYEVTNLSTLTFSETNGTYHYRFGTSATGYSGTGVPGTVRVDGGPVSVTVTFHHHRGSDPELSPAALVTPPAARTARPERG